MSILSITNRLLAYDDASGSTNNPTQRAFDWSRQTQGIPCDNPASEPFRIPPLQQVQIFDGTRTIASDNTTQYSLAVLNVAPNRYRLSFTGVGTDPAFRTDRAVDFLSGSNPKTITVTPQLNQSIAVTASAGSVFSGVVPGDVVYIPGLSTGDPAGIFDPLNEGVWSVLDATTTKLTLARNPGTVYASKAETVTIVDNYSFQVFSSAGVQLDDTLSLVSGFSVALLQNYEIVSVTSDAIEFISGTTLPNIASIVPGSNSIVIFSNAKSFVYLETNQRLDVSLNGNSSTFSVEPLLAGDPSKAGVFQLNGTVYTLIVTNKSTQPATVRVISTE
jgi:hypothetical protein